MMPASQRESVLIGECREIVRVRRVHHKPSQRAPLLSWSKNAYPREFAQAIEGIACQLRIVLENCCASDSIKVINGRGETNCARDIWRTSFESMWSFLERALFQSNAHNHFSAAVPGRHGLQNLLPCVKYSYARRSTHHLPV